MARGRGHGGESRTPRRSEAETRWAWSGANAAWREVGAMVAKAVHRDEAKRRRGGHGVERMLHGESPAPRLGQDDNSSKI